MVATVIEWQLEVNPACAGMILTCYPMAHNRWGKPRVCGDDPFQALVRMELAG